MTVPRPFYTDRIRRFFGAPLIKVLTGVRRCGKSTILDLLADQLQSDGAPPQSIVKINMESLQFEFIRDYRDLYDYVTERIPASGPAWLFVDEIQSIDRWERAIASILADGLADITITGSNASLLSSDLSTLLTGRYIPLEVHPLRFSEFVDFQRASGLETNLLEAWPLYLRYGGFPGLHSLELADDPVFTYLNSLYSTIVLKDVVNRQDIREPSQLDHIIRFVFDNCGNITTAKRISDYLAAQQVKLPVARAVSYLGYLEDAYLLHRCRRYDLKGLRHLELYDKFYPADVGLRHGLIGYRENDISGLLENVVYLELRARGFQVSVGKHRDTEIDFVAEKDSDRFYIQVCYLLASAQTIEREYRALEQIQDSFPKLVLSLDPVQPVDRSGIRWQNLLEFLTSTLPPR